MSTYIHRKYDFTFLWIWRSFIKSLREIYTETDQFPPPTHSTAEERTDK